jgi:hypothetical protein
MLEAVVVQGVVLALRLCCMDPSGWALRLFLHSPCSTNPQLPPIRPGQRRVGKARAPRPQINQLLLLLLLAPALERLLAAQQLVFPLPLLLLLRQHKS